MKLYLLKKSQRNLGLRNLENWVKASQEKLEKVISKSQKLKETMDEILKIAIPSSIAILSWIFVHFFSMDRDRKNKIRDLKTKYLIDAFQKLERNLHIDKLNKNEMESALADIQLFGQPQEVELALKFMNTFSNQGSADLTELLTLLRTNLRKELKLKNPKSDLTFFRFKLKEPENQNNLPGVNQP